MKIFDTLTTLFLSLAWIIPCQVRESAGVAGVLFGAGAACMTQVDTDGGFVGEQGAIAYNPPAVPTGLKKVRSLGARVNLSWDANSEPDP